MKKKNIIIACSKILLTNCTIVDLIYVNCTLRDRGAVFNSSCIEISTMRYSKRKNCRSMQPTLIGCIVGIKQNILNTVTIICGELSLAGIVLNYKTYSLP
jgi:hypothetical protein